MDPATDSLVGNPHLKYRNRPVGGYASRKEARRAAELKLMEKAGVITHLREQVKFVLIPAQEGERECSYVADFVYHEDSGNGYIWKQVVEDVKSPTSRTKDYIIKRKLMLFVHRIRIRET